MHTIVNPNDLLAQIADGNIILIDARAGADCREKFKAQHLQGAQHVHLEDDLSAIAANAKDGGRHPLPDPAGFARLLGKLGITPGSHVVVYDDQAGGNASARFWWMLRAAGHQKVQVIDGGYQAALSAGWPVSSMPWQGQEQPPYPFEGWQLPLADMHQVEQALDDPESLVIDVRETARFLGQTEPYDIIAGHIPGATNLPYSRNMDDKGFFLPSEKLKQLYSGFIGQRAASKVIVHCGSGVTACHTLLAMARAGMQIPALYVGSYSEWCRNKLVVSDDFLS